MASENQEFSHFFWGTATALALAIWLLTVFWPKYVIWGANSFLCVVMIGWLAAIWQSEARNRPPEEPTQPANSRDRDEDDDE